MATIIDSTYGSSLQGPRYFLDELQNMHSLVEKFSSQLSKEDPAKIQAILQRQPGYDTALQSLTFFVPFIENSLASLIKAIDQEPSLYSAEEQRFFDNTDFHRQLADDLFNQSFIADQWFSTFQQS